MVEFLCLAEEIKVRYPILTVKSLEAAHPNYYISRHNEHASNSLSVCGKFKLLLMVWG